MKRVIKLLLIMGVLMNLFGCNSNIKDIEFVSKDDVDIKTTIKTSIHKGTGLTIFDCDTTFKNNSNEELMSIVYCLHFLDGSGNELFKVTPAWNGQNKPLKNGESANDNFGFQQDGKDVKKVIAEVVETKNSIDMPPLHLPEKGEYVYQALNDEHMNNILNELPIYIEAWIDHGGPRETAIFEDEEIIKKVVEDFALIKIADESNTFVTDNYNGAIFRFADGHEYGVSLNLHNLEIRVYNQEHLYELENLGAFWNDIKEYANQE